MVKRVHGHEVLEMILNTGKLFTEESLEQEIMAKFGADARFHTCSAQDMTAKEIVRFLNERGKFISSGIGFTTAREKICSHDDHEHSHE